jgi:hypothetical protein
VDPRLRSEAGACRFAVITERIQQFCRLMAALSPGLALGESELMAALGPRPFSQVIVAVLAATGSSVQARFVLRGP